LKSPIWKRASLICTLINIEATSNDYKFTQDVFLFGFMRMPKICCPKEIIDMRFNFPLVKHVMKIGTQM